MDVAFLRYQYQERHEGVVTENSFKIGIRHVQIVYMIACSATMGAIRGSLGIAVMAINDEERRNDTYIHIHDWDKKIQGTILSAFFFGYCLLLVPAELILKRIGGKAVTTAILAVNGFLCLAMPTIVNKGGWIATCNAIFMMGMTQACLDPANKHLLSKWIPPNESYVCSGLVYGGIYLGIVIALPISGMLAEARLGWELVFYALAMLTLSMAIICGILTASSPDKHQATGDAEKEYIREALSFYKKRSMRMPWRTVLRTRQFWAVAGAHAASNAIFVFYLVDIPVYLRSLHVPMKDCAIYTLLAFIALWSSYAMTAPTIDWLNGFSHISYIFSAYSFRKMINAIGAFGAIIGLSILPNLVPDRSNVTIVVLTAALGSVGFQFSGFLKSLQEMSENFSGTLLLMTSFVASVAGALTPLVTGLIIGDDSKSPKKWMPVFLLLASFYVLCNVVYTIVGSNERQKWDEDRSRQKFGYSNVSTQLELNEVGSTMTNTKGRNK